MNGNAPFFDHGLSIPGKVNGNTPFFIRKLLYSSDFTFSEWTAILRFLCDIGDCCTPFATGERQCSVFQGNFRFGASPSDWVNGNTPFFRPDSAIFNGYATFFRPFSSCFRLIFTPNWVDNHRCKWVGMLRFIHLLHESWTILPLLINLCVYS